MLLRTLVLAQRTADTAVSEARSEAKSITDSAQDRAAKTVAEAEAAANQRLRSSEERAAQTLVEAEENCQLILAEAKRTAAAELATERARKMEEIQALEATRAETRGGQRRHPGQARQRAVAASQSLGLVPVLRGTGSSLSPTPLSPVRRPLGLATRSRRSQMPRRRRSER